MKKLFDKIQIKAPGRNVFDLSFENKFSGNMGELIPFITQEVVPGDKFEINSNILLRLQPMLAPVMHRVDVFTHYFFVPNRIIWDEWENFITGGESGLVAPTIPVLPIDDINKVMYGPGSLADYMGIPPVDVLQTVIGSRDISSLPFRAYQQIYNDYYRDQNLTSAVDYSVPGVLMQLRKRAWEKDYFTSCLPFAQRGAQVDIPISGNADIVWKDQVIQSTTMRDDSGDQFDGATVNIQSQGGIMKDELGNEYINPDISWNHEVDLSTADAVSINDLRRASRLQEFLEKMARAGSRYTEYLLHIFGVRSSDARLQRAEYLGGGKQPVIISEVLNNSAVREFDSNDIETPQGNMSGHGISIGGSNKFQKSFEEHGHIIGIVSVIPRTSYENGINKKFTRLDKLDYYIPSFAQLGEQEVLQQELFADYYGPDINAVFGYQSRYAEYKYNSGQVAGDLRNSLDFWHFGRKFAVPQVLNEDFIECDATHRTFAVIDPDEDKLIFQIFNSIKAIRPMPYFNSPTL